MVVWSTGDERLVGSALAFKALMPDLDSRANMHDPRSWGFTHGVRRPRLPFGASGQADAW